MLDLTERQPRQVSIAARVLAAHRRGDPFAHGKLHAQLRAGNPYLLAWLGRRGLEYNDGVIRARREAR